MTHCIRFQGQGGLRSLPHACVLARRLRSVSERALARGDSLQRCESACQDVLTALLSPRNKNSADNQPLPVTPRLGFHLARGTDAWFIGREGQADVPRCSTAQHDRSSGRLQRSRRFGVASRTCSPCTLKDTGRKGTGQTIHRVLDFAAVCHLVNHALVDTYLFARYGIEYEISQQFTSDIHVGLVR